MIPLFVSYFTPPYRAEAAELVKTLGRFNCAHDVQEIASLGSWEQNCGYKPEFLLAMRAKHHGRPLVWLDADARVLKPPALFDELRCDVAYHLWQGRIVASGTLYFGATSRAGALLRRWADLCAQHPLRWDQVNLGAALAASPELDVTILPVEYLGIFDADIDHSSTVIQHLQRSRQFRFRSAGV